MALLVGLYNSTNSLVAICTSLITTCAGTSCAIAIGSSAITTKIVNTANPKAVIFILALSLFGGCLPFPRKTIRRNDLN